MDSGALPAFAIALSIIAAYLQGPVSTGGTLALPIFASLSNSLGWALPWPLSVSSPSSPSPAASALLIGLFFYDAFFVFKSDVMLTVATQIERPLNSYSLRFERRVTSAIHSLCLDWAMWSCRVPSCH